MSHHVMHKGDFFARAPNMCIGGSGTQASRSYTCIPFCDVLFTETCSVFVGIPFLGARLPESFVQPLNPSPIGVACRHLGKPHLFSRGSIARAQNMCIGCSGAQALHYCHNQCPSWSLAGAEMESSEVDPFLNYLLGLGRVLHSLACSCALAVLLLLVALLIRPVRAEPSPLGFLCGAYVYGTNLGTLVPLGCASPREQVLDWRPWKNRRGKVAFRRSGVCNPLARFCGAMLWWLSLAEPVQATHVSATWFLASSACAMTRPPHPDDPPGLPYPQRRPHLVPPEELTTHVGVCPHGLVSGLRKDREGEARQLLPLDSRCIPTADPECPDTGSEWLSIYLLTPHYKTLTLAIKPPERTMRSALDLLLERSPDHPHRFFDIVVPLRPQRFEGIGSFVRFSSSVRNTGVGGQAVVVFDLTRVGGHYFSAVVAKELAYQTLVDYIVPLTSDDERPLSLYIGHRMRPWPSCALVTLSDGEVVTAVRVDFPAPRPQKAEELFSPTTKWRFPEDVPRFSYCESICVLYRERRYLLPEHHHYGSTSVAYVAEKLHLDPHKTVMCAFTVGDLDVQGELANSVIAVAEVPSPANTGVSRDEACDIFVLLDPVPSA